MIRSILGGSFAESVKNVLKYHKGQDLNDWLNKMLDKKRKNPMVMDNEEKLLRYSKQEYEKSRRDLYNIDAADVFQ